MPRAPETCTHWRKAAENGAGTHDCGQSPAPVTLPAGQVWGWWRLGVHRALCTSRLPAVAAPLSQKPRAGRQSAGQSECPLAGAPPSGRRLRRRRFLHACTFNTLTHGPAPALLSTRACSCKWCATMPGRMCLLALAALLLLALAPPVSLPDVFHSVLWPSSTQHTMARSGMQLLVLALCPSMLALTVRRIACTPADVPGWTVCLCA